MYKYLSLLLNICLLRKGPQDVPQSNLVLRLSLTAYAMVSYLLLHLSTNSLNALLQVGIEIIIILCFTALLLGITHKRQRFVQTMNSLLGTDTLISAFAIPIVASLSLDANNIPAFFTMLALLVWHWIVITHIIRHALEQSFSFSLGITFLYLFSAFQIIGLLFPPDNLAV